MLFCQLGHAKSLREICGGLAASEGKLRHLGLPTAPSRSTLAYANEHRPWQLQRTVFEQLLAKCQMLVARQPETRKKRKFRFKNPLLSLDATVIDLCATMFDWAKFRRTKGAVKLHLLLDHDGYLPSFAAITEGKKHEIRVASYVPSRRALVKSNRGAPRRLSIGSSRITVQCRGLLIVNFQLAMPPQSLDLKETPENPSEQRITLSFHLFAIGHPLTSPVMHNLPATVGGNQVTIGMREIYLRYASWRLLPN
jgi:hypothetical protein